MMLKLKKFIRHLFTPITILIIPHSNEQTYRMKLPSVGIVMLVAMWVAFTGYMVSVGVTTKEYNEIKGRADFYYRQFTELHGTIDSLKKAETQFKKLFAFQTKEDVFKNLETDDSGSIDMQMLKKQIEQSVKGVDEIKEYLKKQQNVYNATPHGSPVGSSRISSQFGWRIHPQTGRSEFHSGLDMAASPGMAVRATADGIVSFAEWSGGSGKLVVIEHGFGYTTCYAHNKEIVVKVGQRVRRGDVVSYVGSTGNSTGPHVHYEVWKNNTPVDPTVFLAKEGEDKQ
ncbi:MAG: M23 family metallopeptidase [Candidatus Magnetobacterium sp. LHC-1]|uniref:M23 family metallopeptidase n=1 Tax=Candidatus Magnetobacterium casense TaxID=1455061 RepID=A0ABS6RY13_9BACT|nr:M23 family metallopeptidase [Candidatus Magnetobacterium casensis]MBF0608316.1 M23 family metallopeptidase [Nitrospirota bacterium]MBV6341532.1 M23 family metallopeptidase [Candidatus Magnetobacterium casensis]